MNRTIETPEDLNDWFFRRQSLPNEMLDGVNITTKIRRDVLTSESQGKIVLNGKLYWISFDNLGGDVYRAYVNTKAEIRE